MRRQVALLPALAALIIIVGSGYVHGLWSYRWSAGREVAAATEKLARVPAAFGDWSGVETPLDDRQIKMARIEASVSRRYTNAKTGRSVSVLLVTGRPGPISVHTPDVCYGGIGYKVTGERSKTSIDFGGARPAEFWAIKVDKPESTRPDGLLIDYGWFAGSSWIAPNADARLQFGGYPVLYKMYLIREQPRPGDATHFDPGAEFLKQFLPTVQEILATPA